MKRFGECAEPDGVSASSWPSRLPGSVQVGSGRSAQPLLQLLAHSRSGLQFRTGLKQVLPQLITFAHQTLDPPMQLFRLLFMLFGHILRVLAGAGMSELSGTSPTFFSSA
jgi:hypothetical protein